MASLLRLRPDGLQWPYSSAQLREDEPRLSLSWELPAAELATLATLDPPVLLWRVAPTEPPPCDPRTERIQEATPEQDGDVWRQTWTVRPATPEEIAAWDAANAPRPDFQAFYDALLISSCYGAALQQVMGASTPAPAAALAVLISAIQDALNGRPNPPALQSAIGLLLGLISLSPEHLTELQELLEAANLDGLLSLAPASPPQP